MSCPALGNYFEITNSRALWYESNYSETVQENLMYPIAVLEEADILVMASISTFDQIGFFLYNMSENGEFITSLE